MMNQDAESAVLGSILMDNSAIVGAQRHITANDFSKRQNAVMWREMLAMYDKNRPIDCLTLTASLEHGSKIGLVGGPERVVSLLESVPTAKNVEHYARIVKEHSVIKRLRDAAFTIESLAAEGRAQEALEHAQKSLIAISKSATDTEFITLAEAAADAHRFIEQIHEAGARVTGISSGFGEIDRLLAGFHMRELVLVAGRPSMGKSALALTFGVNAATDGNDVLMFSLEMDARSLGMRALALGSSVGLQAMRRGECVDGDWVGLARAAGSTESLPMTIVDRSDLTIAQLRGASRLHASKHDLKMIIVDYLQLVRCPGAERREREVAEISAGLKAMAKELDVCVIALSQLNRGLETRPNKRPNLGDLRESGGLEQDADVVMFVYRGETYSAKEEKGVADIIVAKQRQGPCGTAKVRFVAERTAFEDLPTQQSLPTQRKPPTQSCEGKKSVAWIRRVAKNILETVPENEHITLSKLWERLTNRGLPIEQAGDDDKLRAVLHEHGFWITKDGIVSLDSPEPSLFD